MGGMDKRKFFRFESPINLKYTIEKNTQKAKGVVENISREGMVFFTDRKLAKGDTLKLQFEMSNKSMPVFAKGITMWVKKEDKEDIGRRYYAGIKFIDISRFDRGRLLEYVYRQWLKAKKT